MISGGFSPMVSNARQQNIGTLGQMGQVQQQRYANKLHHDMNKKPKKTVGGALAAGAGMALAGAAIGGPGGPWSATAGAVGGFGLGVASYYMS